MTEVMTKAGVKGFDQMLQPVFDAIKNTESLEELDKNVFKLFDEMKSDLLEEQLTESQLNTELFGIATGKQN